jgi:uncharacterized protein YicC (UPF0701 family)
MNLDAFIAPVTTAVLTALGVYVGMSNQLAVLKAELKNLTRQVEKHNSTVERTYKLESDTATMWRRIDELRDEVQRLEDHLDALRVGGSD